MISLHPNFQYKKWTSSRVRWCAIWSALTAAYGYVVWPNQLDFFQGKYPANLKRKSSLLTWAKIVQSENISTPIYVEYNKMYWSKVCVQQFWYFVSGLDIQSELSENDSPVRKKIGCRWQNMTSHIHFSKQFIQTNGLVVKASSKLSGHLGFIPVGCWLCLFLFSWKYRKTKA